MAMLGPGGSSDQLGLVEEKVSLAGGTHTSNIPACQRH